MLHGDIDVAVKNQEGSSQGRVIHKGEGFTDSGNKTVLEHRKEASVWVYGNISEHVQKAKFGGVRACNVDQESASAHLRVGVDA